MQSCRRKTFHHRGHFRCLFLVQGLHSLLALLLGTLLLGHILGHGGSGVSVKGRGLLVGFVLDGLDGELLLALLRRRSVLDP
jgi:hypothetical protein